MTSAPARLAAFAAALAIAFAAAFAVGAATHDNPAPVHQENQEHRQ